MKGNLIHYHIKEIIGGMENIALLTNKGELLLHGTNEHGIFSVSDDLIDLFYFSNNFMKLDHFNDYNVLSVALGLGHMVVLCESKDVSGEQKVFSIGNNMAG